LKCIPPATDTNRLYELALQYQAQLHAEEDRRFFASLPFWNGIKSILDVGCGPGAFHEVIECFLRAKTYLGIDIEARFIEAARSRFETPTRKFQQTDFFQVQGSFDLLIFWAVLQHLPDVESALVHARQLLSSQGYLIAFDTGEGDEHSLYPVVPSLAEMYRQLEKNADHKGRNSKCLGDLRALAPKHGFEILIEEKVAVPIAKVNRQRFVEFSLVVSELLHRFYGIATDQKILELELTHWSSHPSASASLTGGEWVVLRKRA
jgi:trans-aconitate methyltransferase